jgi:hypothetical protein
MKSTLALLLISAFAFAQPSQVPTLSVWRITKDTLCVKDSFKLNYKITPPGIQTNTLIGIVVNNPNDTIWKGNYKTLEKRPKEMLPGLTSPNDSTNYIWLKLPQYKVPGTYSIVTQTYMSYLNRFVILNCNLVGIQEYAQASETPVYFDLNGNKIEKRSNELIIEQVGLRRRKIFISKE